MKIKPRCSYAKKYRARRAPKCGCLACLKKWDTRVPKPTGTEAAVIADITRRQALGIAKYGQTVAENPLQLRQWLQHQYEELLDAAVYCKRAIEELEKQTTTNA